MSSDVAPQELGITESGALSIRWPDDERALVVSAELLRVYSPSAEVRGHDGIQRLVTNKAAVKVKDLELIGHYGLKLVFDDGHDSGIYTWEYLADMCRRRDSLYRDYRARLRQAGGTA